MSVRYRRLFLERKKRGMTLQEVGAATGVGYSTLARLEKAQMEPYPVWAMKLSRFYEVPTAELFAEVAEVNQRG